MLLLRSGEFVVRVVAFFFLQIVTHNADTLLVIYESALGFNLLKKTGNLEVGVIVLWIELAYMSKQFQSFILILWGT